MKDQIHRDDEGHGNMQFAKSRISIQQKLCCDDGKTLRVAVMAGGFAVACCFRLRHAFSWRLISKLDRICILSAPNFRAVERVN